MTRWLLPLLLVAATLAQPARAQDDDGTRLERLIESQLSGDDRDVRIEGFRGVLSSEATLDRMTISDAEGTWLILEDAVLDWRRAALLRGELRVTALTAERLSILRQPVPPEGVELPEAEATPFSLPDLPVSIQIGEIAIGTLELGEPILGVPAELTLTGQAQLADGSGAIDVQLERLDGAEGAFTLDASFDNATRVLDIDLLLDEEDGGLAATILDIPDTPPLRLTVAGEGPLDDITVDIGLATGGVERVDGVVRSQRVSGADGEAGAQVIEIDLAGDLSPLLATEYRPFFGESSEITARVERRPDGATRLENMRLASAALNLEGDVTLDPEGRPVEIDVSGRIVDPGNAGPVRLPVPGAETLVSSADLNLDFDAAESDAFSLTMRADGLRVDDLSAASAGISATGRIVPAAGGVGAVTADVSAELSGLDHADPALAEALGPAIAFMTEASWSEGDPIRLDALSLRSGDLFAEGGISVGLGGNELPVTFDLAAEIGDLARFSGLAGQDLSGAVRTEIAGTAEPLSGAFDIAIDAVARDVGTAPALPPTALAGETRLSLAAVRDTEGTRIETLDLVSGDLALTGSAALGGGEGTAPLSYDVSLEAGSLSRFAGLADLGLGGSIDADLEGTADLETGAFDLVLDGTARDLRATPALPPEVLAGETTVRLVAARDAGGITIETLDLVSGDLGVQGQGALMSGEDSAPFGFDVNLDIGDLGRFSGLAGQELGGALQAEAEGMGDLTAGSFDVTLDARARDLRAAAIPPQLLDGQTTLNVSAERDADGTLILETLDLDGTQVTLDGAGRLTPGGGTLELDARLANLGLFTTAVSGPATASVAVTSGSGSGEGYGIDGRVTGPGGIAANVMGRVGLSGGRVDLGIRGSAPLSLANQFILPQSVTGTLNFDLGLRGQPGLEALSGSVTTSGARLTVPAARLALENLGLTARLNGGRISFDGGANVSTGGRVSLSGSVNAAAPGVPGNVDVTLASVRLVDPTLYDVLVDRGDISVSGALAQGPMVAGRIVLGESELRVPESGVGGAAPVPDALRHVNMTPPERRTLAAAGFLGDGNGNGGGTSAIGLDLEIVAPGRIFLRGRGIDAEFGGSIRIGGTTANVIPAGRFELVRGRLSILGTRLDFTEGAATLQGDFDPFLDLRATSLSGGYRIFIDVDGPVSSPDITLSSDPFLPEDEILAQLLFGRSVSALSPVQLIQLADAASSLVGGGSGGGLLTNLREGLGLDNLDLQTDDQGNAAVRAGRYLSENIYTDVTVGAEGDSEVSLNIDLTPSITARGSVSSDGGSSLGVFFERDY